MSIVMTTLIQKCFTFYSHSVHSLQSAVEMMEGPPQRPLPIPNGGQGQQRDSLLPSGRSVSLVDLQDVRSLQDAPQPLPHHEGPCLSRSGSRASISAAPTPAAFPSSNPVTPALPQSKAPHRDLQPQSAPQVRRLQPPLTQQRSLQPLSFQNPVYHLINPANSLSTRSAHSLRRDSSSENLSTESSHNSHSNSDDFGSQEAGKACAASNSSLDEGGSRRSTQSEEYFSPRRLVRPNLAQSAATAVAIPRQSTTTGTAHIVKVEQQSRVGGGARTPHSLPVGSSLCSSSSANTEPTPTAGPSNLQQSSVENVVPPTISTAKAPSQVLHHRARSALSPRCVNDHLTACR